MDTSATVSVVGAAPEGPLGLIDGWFTYEPAASDRFPFEIAITSLGQAQVVTIIPRPDLPSEEKVINLDFGTPLPDETDVEFRSIIEQPVPGKNNRIVVSGKHLVIEQGAANSLWDQLSGAEECRIYGGSQRCSGGVAPGPPAPAPTPAAH